MICNFSKIQIALDALHLMNPKIKKSLLNTNYQDREDLEQEIKLKLFEAIIEDRIAPPPSFWEFQSIIKKKEGIH